MKILYSLILYIFFITSIAYGWMNALVVGGGVPAAGGGPSALYTAATEIYDFDNDATAVKDAAHNLSTAAGTPAYATTGPDGSSHYLDLDGASYLTLADDADFDVGAADYSISIWVRFDADNDDGIVTKGLSGASGGGWRLYTDYITTDRFVALSNIDTWTITAISTTFAPPLSTWYHIVVAYDDDAANEFTVWISSSGGTFGDQLNGTALNMDTIPEVNAEPLYVGFDDVTNAIHGGDIDEFVWFNGKALNATEAEAIYDGNWR